MDKYADINTLLTNVRYFEEIRHPKTLSPFFSQLKVPVWLNINCHHPHYLCVPVNHQYQSLRKQITILYKAETGKNTLMPQKTNCTEKYKQGILVYHHISHTQYT